MTNQFLKIIGIGMFALLFACQDRENKGGPDKEIFPAEEKKDELREDDRPMSRSYLLAKMREDDELSTFTQQLSASGIEEEFEGEEEIYTIFAPSNAAYDRIPAEEMNQVDTTGKANEMRYYMVEGEMTVDFLRERIRASEDGNYEFQTALGEKIWATEEGDKIILTDVLGNKASIVTSNMDEYYGVYHIIDNTLRAGDQE